MGNDTIKETLFLNGKQEETGTIQYKKHCFQRELVKKLKNTGMGKTRFNMIWRNAIQKKFGHYWNTWKKILKRNHSIPKCHGMKIQEQI